MTKPDTIVKLTIGLRPEGGAPEPLLIQDDREARLVFDAVTPEDTEVIAIVRFNRVLASRFGYPNDEALPGHPLYAHGMDHHWIYEVLQPTWLEQLKIQNAVSFPTGSRWSQRHFIVTLKDSTFECLADDYQVTTSQQDPRQIIEKALRTTT
jgi:hypothetical protein